MTDDEMRDVFQAMRDEPVPADSLVRVRSAVAARTQGRRWPVSLHLAWKIAVAAAALATVVLVVFLFDRASTPVHSPGPRVVVREEQAPPVEPPPTSVARSAPLPGQPSATPPRRIEKRSSSGEGLLIRIETPDPDVVILLVGDRAG